MALTRAELLELVGDIDSALVGGELVAALNNIVTEVSLTESATSGITIVRVPLVAEASPTVGGAASWQNTLAVPVFVRTMLQVTTQTNGAANMDIGVDSDGTTSSDTLHDGDILGSSPFSRFSGTGSNGSLIRVVGAGEYVVATALADSTGLVGNLFIEYWQ